MKQIAFFLIVTSAFAQQSVTSATLGGVVEDPSGAAVRGASITALNLERNQRWIATSDKRGRYLLPLLPVGVYEVRIEREAFATETRRLTLTVGETADLPVRLSLAGGSSVVNVNSEAPLVETTRTQAAETIQPREIAGLPLNGRNYLDLALLTPLVSRTNTGSNERFAETSAVPGTGISIAGQRNLNTGFIIDGLSATDDAADLAGTFYSQEVIREFQVITSGGIAEFGRSSSGTINILTKSGANDPHGNAYGFVRNQRFDARNPLLAGKDPLTQAQYGASLGGPVVRDRAFLFGNFEQTRQHRAGAITILPANVAAINSVLHSIGYEGRDVTTGEYPTGYDSSNFFGKLDHRISQAQSLSARYSLYDVASWNARNVGGLGAISRGTALANRDQTVALNHLFTASANRINEARFQWTRSRLGAPVNDLQGPAINISGIANIGTATSSPTRRDLDVYELSDSFSVIHGTHFFKAGADFLMERVHISFPGALQGVYSFSSLANFQAGRYFQFQQAFGAPDQFQSNPNLGIFAQDEWRVRPSLTINVGLRYDLQMLPHPIQLDKRDIAPRIGIAWSPGDRKTVLRANAGIYYDRTPLRATSNALQRDGSKYRTAIVSFGEPSAPLFPSVLPAFPSGLLVSITTIDPRIRNSYAIQAGAQAERQLTAATSVTLGYEHLRGIRILMSRNINVPTVSAADAARLGIANLNRPDSRWANVSQYEGTGDSYFDGMTVSVRHVRKRASLRLSYTFSKSIDDAGNAFFSTPQDNFNLRDDRGLSNNDQRHRLSANGIFQLPGSFEIGAIFGYASPLPFNLQTGNDRNNDTNPNDRPIGIGRNTGVGFAFSSVDVRLSRTFRVGERLKVEALAESFNTLNRTNLQFPNNIYGTGTTPLPSFGGPTATGDPRQLQLALRFSM